MMSTETRNHRRVAVERAVKAAELKRARETAYLERRLSEQRLGIAQGRPIAARLGEPRPA